LSEQLLSLAEREAGAIKPESPEPIVQNVEARRPLASREDEDRIATALPADECPVERSDAGLRVSELKAAIRAPAGRLVKA
jgi:hypothetical protein